MKNQYPKENGEICIGGKKLTWTMRRSKGGSAFGIHGSRIFELAVEKDGEPVCVYDRGWIRKVAEEDDEGAICLSYLLDKYGRETHRKRKE